MSRTTDKVSMPRSVAVIGAGIVGIACAIYLQRDGHKVTVVDRLPPGEGASLGNAGILASCAVVPVATPGIVLKAPAMLLDPLGPLSFRWLYLPRMLPWLYRFVRNASRKKVEQIADALSLLLNASVDEHQALAAGTGAEPWVRPAPYLYVYEDEASFNADAYAWKLRTDRGVRFDILRDGELHEMVPSLSPKYRFAAALENHGFTPDPMRLVKALAEHFERNGGTVLQREAKDIEFVANSPVRLVTDEGKLEFDELVIAAGAWSGKFAARLGDAVPLEAERGYHITIENPEIDLDFPIMSSKGKFVVTPMSCGLRLAGLVEFGGLLAPPDYKRARTLLRHAKQFFPGVNTSSYSEWMGHRPSLPDSLPVIGRSSRFPSVYYAFGHQHIGLTAGPKTGRLIADLVSRRTPNIDLSPFRVGRF